MAKEYIEREALLNKIWYGNGDSIVLRGYASDMAKSIPTADVVEVRHGEWVDKYCGKYANQLYACSVCYGIAGDKAFIDCLGSERIGWALTPYCPNCGAKMDGKGEG